MPVPFDPSAEQQAIVESFLTGTDLVVQALAGTGKSTVLAFIAQAQLQHRPTAAARYITFNKRNATEVQETFNSYGITNAKASTAHSLAYSGCRASGELRHMVDRLGKAGPKLGDEMKLLGIGYASRCLNTVVVVDPFNKGRYFSVKPPKDDPAFKIQRRFLTLARKTVEKFCQSSDRSVAAQHVPSLAEFDEGLRRLIREALVLAGQRMWDELNRPTSPLPTNHSHYLKAWALTNPVVGNRGDVLLYDEAQDASPVLADIVLAQRGRVQLVLVGDRHQQIYTFTGSVNAMQDFAKLDGVSVLPLTECRRFGSTIAAEANSVLDRLDPAGGIRLVGVGPAGQVVHEYTPRDTFSVQAVVCRTNAGVLQHIQDQLHAGRAVYATLDVAGLTRLARDVTLVLDGCAGDAKHPVLQGFTDLERFNEWLDDDDPENEDLRDQVRMLVTCGVEEVLATLRRLTTDQEAADVTVSTVHKAKGGTWDQVLVDMGEFVIDDDDDEMLRLLYVALTRARHRVLWRPAPAKDERDSAA